MDGSSCGYSTEYVTDNGLFPNYYHFISYRMDRLGKRSAGKFLSLKTEDFVIAARLDGASEMRIITRHMVPSYLSHIIASVTLAIPAMILSETSLSFLGVGLRPPVVSWGSCYRKPKIFGQSPRRLGCCYQVLL